MLQYSGIAGISQSWHEFKTQSQELLVLTTIAIRISFAMAIVYCLFSLTFAIEGGYSIPAVGFSDTRSGVMSAVAVSYDLTFIDTGLRGKIAFYPGDNEAYSVTTYGIQCFFTKHAWRVAPVVDIGVEYVDRSLGGMNEQGSAMNYGLGLVINIPLKRMRVYPQFNYQGITDFARQGGMLGVQLGIAYDF